MITEILNILYLLIIFFSAPNIFTKISNKLLNNRSVDKLDIFSLNLLIFIFILFILSFLKIKLEYVKYLLILFSIFTVIKNIKNKKNYTFDAFLLLFFSIIYCVDVADKIILNDDGNLWVFKTLNFFYGESFQNLKNVPGHLNYPHLGSYLWALFWKISFINHEYTGRLFFVFLFIFSIILVVKEIKSNILKIILSSTFFFLTYNYYLLSGYMEFFSFSLLTIFFFVYIKFFFGSINSLKKIIFIFLSIIIILFTKNETLFFLLFFFLSFEFLKDGKINFNKNILIYLSLLISGFLVKYLINIYYFDQFIFTYGGSKNASFDALFNVARMVERLIIVFEIIKAIFKFPIYIIFIFIVMFKFTNTKKLKYNNIFSYLAFLFINFIFVFLIYYNSAENNWLLNSRTTLDRLLFQTSGIYIIFIIFFLKKNNLLRT